MHSDELFERLETACREAGGYLLHSKDALAKLLELPAGERATLTDQLKSLSEQGRVVVERRGRAGLLVALPDVPLPDTQKKKKQRAASGAGPGRPRRASGRNADARNTKQRRAVTDKTAAADQGALSHFCPWCGKPIAPAWNYCANCGEPLETVKDLYDRRKIM